MRTPLGPRLGLAVAAALVVAACSGGADEAPPEPPASTDAAGEEFNDADVTFATEMVPHHAQALELVELSRGRPLSPRVRGVADQIAAAQAPEIEQMTGWLETWGEPVPEGAGMEGMEGMEMPGMATAAELAALGRTPDAEFEVRWLELMIAHHEGAVEMAEVEIEEGLYPPAVALAEEIETTQDAEADVLDEELDALEDAADEAEDARDDRRDEAEDRRDDREDAREDREDRDD